MQIEQLSIKLDENETHNILGALKSRFDSLNREIDGKRYTQHLC